MYIYPMETEWKGGNKMPIIQFQKGSLMTSIPKEIKTALGLQKGDSINFNISKGGKIEVVKIKEVK